MAALEFGLNPLPPGVEVAWGCRAIITQDGTFDVPPDRMGAIGPEEERKALLNHLNTHASTNPWEKAKRLLRDRELRTNENRQVTLYEDNTIIVVANPNASHGYLYVAAFYKADASPTRVTITADVPYGTPPEDIRVALEGSNVYDVAGSESGTLADVSVREGDELAAIRQLLDPDGTDADLSVLRLVSNDLSRLNGEVLEERAKLEAGRYAIQIPEDQWYADEAAGMARLHSLVPVTINGLPMHLEAWQVEMVKGLQEAVGPWAEDLNHLTQIYEPGKPFATVEINGRDYILVAFPHAD